ncbi:esterase FE4-like [Bicyclus anynana]|uniref:Carboxylic ester hydrolase n=1 Tax=Bicyclus anynana TaxID=110368 RepID=A0A6J1MS16_BICAN|nr:esterase FE4-like [Bicyclus anynana]
MIKVEITDGILEGTEEKNKYGDSYFSFKGIPYAEPPLGDLRFKAPQKPKPWKGVRPAKEFGPICYQYDVYNKKIHGSEDCLYLNVYTPELKPTKPIPVMFWIHGGGLINGSGNDDLYGPEFLIRQNVILVTINYRLEVLGFLCLHTKDVPGNAGIKDQVAALRWVNKNIERFGGDPDNVTIFGESAGGACVSFHCMSPMSKGLFKRAIIQSGIATCWLPNVFQPRERALVLARDLGCESDNETDIIEFFKSQPIENLINKQIKLTLMENIKEYPCVSFGIVSEKEFPGVERYFHGDIYDVLRKGIHEDIEVMNGYTEDEGIIFLAGNCDLPKIYEQSNNCLEYFVPKPIEINCPLTIQIEVGTRLKKFYFGQQKVSSDTLDQFVKYVSADNFIYPSILWQKIVAKRNKNVLFFYKFNCKSERNIFTQLMGIPDLFQDQTVVCHGDDLPYIFPVKIFEQNISMDSEAFKMIDKVTKLWTNFAKYGDPTPDNTLGVKWSPYTRKEENYIIIEQFLTASKAPDSSTFDFWESIFKEFYPHVTV